MNGRLLVAEISLSDAAHRLKKSYQVTLDMLLRGHLEGRRDARGRWVVTEESVTRAGAEVRRLVDNVRRENRPFGS